MRCFQRLQLTGKYGRIRHLAQWGHQARNTRGRIYAIGRAGFLRQIEGQSSLS